MTILKRIITSYYPKINPYTLLNNIYNVCVRVCVYMCIHVCTYVCMCTYVYTCIYMCVRMYTCTHMCTSIYVYIYVRVYENFCKCIRRPQSSSDDWPLISPCAANNGVSPNTNSLSVSNSLRARSRCTENHLNNMPKMANPFDGIWIVNILHGNH